MRYFSSLIALPCWVWGRGGWKASHACLLRDQNHRLDVPPPSECCFSALLHVLHLNYHRCLDLPLFSQYSRTQNIVTCTYGNVAAFVCMSSDASTGTYHATFASRLSRRFFPRLRKSCKRRPGYEATPCHGYILCSAYSGLPTQLLNNGTLTLTQQ